MLNSTEIVIENNSIQALENNGMNKPVAASFSNFKIILFRVPNSIFGQCGLGNEMSYKGNNEYFTQKCELNADFLDPKCVHTEIIQRVKDLILFLYTHTRLSVVRKASFFFFLLSLSSCSIATLFFGTWTATAPPLCLTPRCE